MVCYDRVWGTYWTRHGLKSEETLTEEKRPGSHKTWQSISWRERRPVGLLSEIWSGCLRVVALQWLHESEWDSKVTPRKRGSFIKVVIGSYKYIEIYCDVFFIKLAIYCTQKVEKRSFWGNTPIKLLFEYVLMSRSNNSPWISNQNKLAFKSSD